MTVMDDRIIDSPTGYSGVDGDEWGRRGASSRRLARRDAAGPQLPAAGHPGRRRPRRRLARRCRGSPRTPPRTRSSSAACTSWRRRPRSCRYDKTVLIPDQRAGCSLADSITADELRAWKAEHPGAVVVSYVNTTAAVKAETDICCTSSNAVEVVASIPADREVLFLPDQFLGAHVQRRSPAARTCTSGSASATCTPASTAPSSRQGAAYPTPSCSSTPSAVARPRALPRRRRCVPRGRAQRSCPPAAC